MGTSNYVAMKMFENMGMCYESYEITGSPTVVRKSNSFSHDPRWTAIHKNDYTNSALHFYNENLATTLNGTLNISTVLHDVTFRVEDGSATNSMFTRSRATRGLRKREKRQATAGIDTATSGNEHHRRRTSGNARYKTKHYQSGMLQSWNKFCFTGTWLVR